MPDKRPAKKRKPPKRKKPAKKTAVTAAPIAGGYRVIWLPDADAELKAIEDAKEQVALRHVGEKLAVEGPRLGYPHSSAVQAEAGKGFRELRPRRGRSPWRAIYRQVNKTSFVVLAVGPEAEVNESGFNAAVKSAKSRFATLQANAKKKGS